jgi:hypothetical protein
MPPDKLQQFSDFDLAVEAFREFLAAHGWPTQLKWLVSSRAFWDRDRLYVYCTSHPEDPTCHRERFRKALEAGVNIALVAYGQHHGSAWVGLETPGLDSRGDAIKESGSHNLKLVQPPLAVVEVRSPLKWLLMSRFATKARRRTDVLGWPA